VAAVALRYTYSRWDGTQRGFELDDDDVLAAITDDLIEHGDVNAALRRLLNDGLRAANGEAIAGLRELLQRLRDARRQRLAELDLGDVYEEISRELSDIVDEERHAVDVAEIDERSAADRRGDDAAAEAAGRHADDRRLALDLLPDDLAGRIAALRNHEFLSPEARRRFDELVERLREQLANRAFEQMSGSMQGLSPGSQQRLKEMLADLNQMLARHRRGEDPRFDEFMARHGDFFPEGPETIEELLESIAQRAAAMQALLGSMTPEQRDELMRLSEAMVDELGLREQLGELGAQLQALAPDGGWGAGEFGSADALGLGAALDTMGELAELDRLESLLRGITSPNALAEVDPERVGELLGDDAMRSLQRLAELSRRLAEAGLIENTETGLRLTPRGVRQIGENALREVFQRLTKDQIGQHETVRTGYGHERTPDSKPYEFGDPFRLDLQRTIRNALVRRATAEHGPRSGLPVELVPDDFEIELTEHLTRSSTVLMLDLSMSMPMEGRFVPAKKVAMALQALIASQFPRDYLGVVVFSETARVIRAAEIPEASWDYVYGTNMHHALTLARQLLGRQHGSKQIIMVTDGEPTAHVLPDGEVYFHYPPVRETIEATLREVVRCTSAGIRINTFMLGATQSLKAFVERISEINRGRAFFATPENLGDYVLVDFLEHRRTMTRSRRAG
jgi:uncharacterized protein with von Willebrand factor type A (vWA) domain